MAWGANLTLGPGGDFTSTVAQAGANGTVTLTGNVTVTPQFGNYVMIMQQASPITINLAGYTLDFSSCMLMQMMSTVNFTGAGEVTGTVSFMNSGNNLNFAAGFNGTASITMMNNSGGTINIQGTSGLYSESIKNFPSLTLPSGKKLAKLRDCDTYYSVVDNAYETQSCIVAEPVAQIGEIQYTSLETAFAEATNGSTIQMLDDVVMDYEDDEESYIIVIDNYRKITLDLNGHNITGKLAFLGKNLIYIESGSLTVQGTGEFNVTEKVSGLEADAVVEFDRIITVNPVRINGVPVAKLNLKGGSFALKPAAAYIPECYQVDEVSSRYVVSEDQNCESLKAFLEKEGTDSRTISADYDISDKGVIYVNGNKTLTIASGATLFYKRQGGNANIIVNNGATLTILGSGTIRPIAGADINDEANPAHAMYEQLKTIPSAYDGNRAIDVDGELVVGVKNDADNCPHFVTTSIAQGNAIMINAGGTATINNADIQAAMCAIRNYGTTYINGGTYVSTSTSTNGVNGNFYSYCIRNENKLVLKNAKVVGNHGAVSCEGGNGTLEIHNCNLQARDLSGLGGVHYALYVCTKSIVSAYDTKFYSENGSNTIVIGDNDSQNSFGLIYLYGGCKTDRKLYVQKKRGQDDDILFPVLVSKQSEWYTLASNGGKDTEGKLLPANTVYSPIDEQVYDINGDPIDGKKYLYSVVSTAAKTEDATGTTIPWQQNTTWTDTQVDHVPSATTAVTIPAGKTVVVSKDEEDTDAVAEQIFLADGAKLTVETGTTLKVGEGGINVANGGQIVVEPGAIVTVGSTGLVTTEDEALVIEATEEDQGVFLLQPAVTENTQPKATVKLVTKCKQVAANEFIWERFAIPTLDGNATIYGNEGLDTVHYYGGGSSLLEGLYEWDGSAWAGVSSWKNLEPFKGYQLTNNSMYGNVVYTFEGNLVGNVDQQYQFAERGFGFFGNSYTGDIDIQKFFESFGPDMQKTIWIYDYYTDGFKAITETSYGSVYYGKRNARHGLITDIRSMQAFLMNTFATGASVQSVDYSAAIWGNPKYGLVPTPTPAPAKRVAANEDKFTVYVAGAKQEDEVTFIRSNAYSAAFDNGADASKWMNNGLNLYVATEDGELASVASDEIVDMTIAFQSGNETEYTLGFDNLRGEQFELRDVLTGATIQMTEGATYAFSQEANTTVPARFQIIGAKKVPTGVENVAEGANVQQKIMVNGVLYILRDNKWYNAQGQIVK